MTRKRMVAATTGTGRLQLVEQDVPEVKSGTVLVEVHASLVSAGTELGGGWAALRAQKDDPKPLDKPSPFGYSNSGVVLEVGEGVERLKPGDRVACMGGGYAMHTDFAVVPHNMCAVMPDNTTFAQGAYACLASTSLMGLRRCEPEFGEYVLVVGLGVVGQLAAQLMKLAGTFVMGWDRIPMRVETARGWGIDAALVAGEADAVEETRAFTRGYGLDAAVWSLGGDATKVQELTMKCMKVAPDGHRMGRVVVVGGVKFAFDGSTHNVDFRRSARTGPGYHDDAWEVGPDYPPVFVRWTTLSNMELCVRLMSEGRLDVDCLTTHTIPLANVDEGVQKIIEEPDSILGVVFSMNE